MPVSYTHLDVYKRQACSSAGNIQRWHYLDYWIDGWIIGTDSGSVFSWRYADRVSGSDDLFGLYAADPVSYTHLDVYKRQGQ